MAKPRKKGLSKSEKKRRARLRKGPAPEPSQKRRNTQSANNGETSDKERVFAGSKSAINPKTVDQSQVTPQKKKTIVDHVEPCHNRVESDDPLLRDLNTSSFFSNSQNVEHTPPPKNSSTTRAATSQEDGDSSSSFMSGFEPVVPKVSPQSPLRTTDSDESDFAPVVPRDPKSDEGDSDDSTLSGFDPIIPSNQTEGQKKSTLASLCEDIPSSDSPSLSGIAPEEKPDFTQHSNNSPSPDPGYGSEDSFEESTLLPSEASEIEPVSASTTPAKKERKRSTAGCVGGFNTSSGMRGYQEDRYCVDDSCAYYAVYDGHGGEAGSHFCEKHMEDYVMDRVEALPPNASDEDVEKACKDAFIALDERFLLKRVDDGSTACVGFISHDGKNGKLHVANVGDTRAIVVCDDSSVIEMSRDHKPDDPIEKKRIVDSYHDVQVITDFLDGKRIKIARVDGILAVARAIGDGSLKDMKDPAKCAVTCVPEVRHLPLNPEKHKFLVIACDGIWDVYSNEEVAAIVHKELAGKKKPISVDDLNNVAQIIVESAIDKGSMDNCTAVVVAL